MEFASFKTPNGKSTYGMVTGDRVVDLGADRPNLPSLKAFIGSDEFVSGKVAPKGTEYALSEVTLLPVIPDAGKIICVGLNYSEHIKETGRSDSEFPVLFLRTNTSQAAHEAPLLKPTLSERFDYEGELALVIGKPGRHISKSEAMSHVAGYACYNDGSVRDYQRHTHQYTGGKNFDQTGSFGPTLVMPDVIKDRATTMLITRVNGQEVQKASLAQMIFTIEDVIAYASSFTTLETGDVIVTGTPGGVGDRRTPPLYLHDGDVVEVEITGVGVLKNTVVQEK
ncbi:MAG: putative bifunctional enzyme with isomerase/decarboxylase [Hyphomicrobiales bacterium]|nr:putative bifunctional enzyme with isomerase/decarboxylase [Hyphomicrobiales bacterium]